MRKLYICTSCGEITSKVQTIIDRGAELRHCPFCGAFKIQDYNQDDEFLTVDEFAERMKMSKSGIYTMVADGRIPCHRVYRQVRLRISDFESERIEVKA